MKTRAVLVAVACIGGHLLAGAPARADDKAECATAAEHAQALRDGAKLRAALDELISCSRPACPAIVREDCVRWTGDVRAQMPTLILRAHDARGRDVAGVKVKVDGAPLVQQLDGVAVGVDPGPHRLRFQAASGAASEIEVVVAEAEKRRAVTVAFDVPLEMDGSATRAGPPPAPAAVETGSPARLPLYVAGGIGIAALASFAFFEITGQSDYRELRDTCGRSHACEASDVDATQTKLTVGLVSLGVAAVAAGVFTWLLVRDGSPSRRTRTAVAW